MVLWRVLLAHTGVINTNLHITQKLTRLECANFCFGQTSSSLLAISFCTVIEARKIRNLIFFVFIYCTPVHSDALADQNSLEHASAVLRSHLDVQVPRLQPHAASSQSRSQQGRNSHRLVLGVAHVEYVLSSCSMWRVSTFIFTKQIEEPLRTLPFKSHLLILYIPLWSPLSFFFSFSTIVFSALIHPIFRTELHHFRQVLRVLLIHLITSASLSSRSSHYRPSPFYEFSCITLATSLVGSKH